ncbi:MAG: radical SAM family heme chaperone HemW [Chloroflexota bacterium]
MSAQPLALYVHIPFCETKCPYCDFNTYAGIAHLMPAYVAALEHELAGWGRWLGRPELGSVFFGGGTPSFLPTRDLARLMRAIREAFLLREDAEVTVEANPGDCARERLQAMRRAGFNRISIGVQSFDDAELVALGRRHDAAQARVAVATARLAGFERISLDLMFGLPRQYFSTWAHTVEEALALGTEHLSAYALTLEGGTPMEADTRAGRLPEADPDLAAEMYRHLQAEAVRAGLAQYEVSNWARPGRESCHNLAYWRVEPYLGVGPGAHSHLYDAPGLGIEALGPWGVRFANAKPPRAYMEQVNAWEPGGPLDADAISAAGAVESAEAVDAAMAQGEFMMMGLRLNEGVWGEAFAARFGMGIETRFPHATAECLELGLLEWADGRLRLTEDGRLLGNEAFSRFVTEGR